MVIPAFNEVASAAKLCESLIDLEVNLPNYEFQFIIVDDGSSDATVDVVRDLLRHRSNASVIVHETNRGVAAAIMTGIDAASTEIVCSMDFDCSYDPAQIGDLLALLTEDVDLVTASPYHRNGSVRNVPGWRLFVSRCASLAYRTVLGLDLHTFTSCFRAYRRNAVREMELRNEGFVGVAELLWRMQRRGARIVECPVELSIREFGQSKMRVVQVTLGHLRLLGRILLFRICPAGWKDNELALPRYPVPQHMDQSASQ